MNKKFIFYYILALLLSPCLLYAGPWIQSSPYNQYDNLAIKSDIDLLTNYGIIKSPVLTWPISWDNIGPSLESNESQELIKKCPMMVINAWKRLIDLYHSSTQQHSPHVATYISGGGNINPFRTFEWQPRADFEGGVSIENQNEIFAANFSVNYGDYNDLTQTVHFDNSYLYLFLGNWGLGVEKVNKWWGPAYSDSLILSANAPPLPSITLQRMKAEPFQSKWLKWIGPWTFTNSFSIGDDKGPVQNPIIWLTNLSFRPIETLQFSLSRVARFGGKERPLNKKMLFNLLTFRDNCSPSSHSDPDYCKKNTPGTELLDISFEWSPRLINNLPTSFYMQTIFNDGHLFFHNSPIGGIRFPWRTNFLVGTSAILSLNSNKNLRLYSEFQYMIQKAYWLWNISDYYTDKFIIYNIYGYSQYPYYYHNKIIGSPLGGESKAINLGAILTDISGESTSFLFRYIRLNTYGRSGRGYPFHQQDVVWLSINKSIHLPNKFGQLSGQLGYMTPLKHQDNNKSLSGFMVWKKRFD